MIKDNYNNPTCNNCNNSNCDKGTYHNPINPPVCSTHVDNSTGFKFGDVVSRVDVSQVAPTTENTMQLFRAWM